MKLDKLSYKLGDIIRLYIVVLVVGKGYVMVEFSEGLLWWQEIDVLVEGMDLLILVDKIWNCYDFYFSMLVVCFGDKLCLVMLKCVVGLLYLLLGDENCCLMLVLEVLDKICFNQLLMVKVKVSVKEGEVLKQVNVLFLVVDSGVLNIIDYVILDLWNVFFGQKCYGVDIYDIYGQVIEGQGCVVSLCFGGDGDELKCGGKLLVNYVMIVVQQVQLVVLNDQGEGMVMLFIGDFNGELWVMVQVWMVDDFGSSEDKVVVVVLVIVELNILCFFVSGDIIWLVLDFSNLIDKL